MMNRLQFMEFLFLCSLLVCLAGCLAKTQSDATYLLEQDYQQMTDMELIAHEQQLSDELVASSSHSNGDVSVGVGFGSWGNSGGFGVSAGKWLGRSGDNDLTLELRARRNAVRSEMRQRGLLPQQE